MAIFSYSEMSTSTSSGSAKACCPIRQACTAMTFSMQRRLRIVVFVAVDDPKAPLAARKPILIPIDPQPDPRIVPTQINVADRHPSQMGEMGHSGLARGDR